MGVTADTPTNLVVGAGEIHVDLADLGASTGNNLFAIDRTIFTPQLNGLKGALLGTDYVVSSVGRIETTIPEVSAEVLAKGWPGSQSAVVGGATTIDENNTRRIPLSDYHNWKLEVERLGGGAFEFLADNAIQTGALEYETQDADLVAPRFNLVSRWDPAALTASPHRIRIVDVAS